MLGTMGPRLRGDDIGLSLAQILTRSAPSNNGTSERAHLAAVEVERDAVQPAPAR